MLLPRVFYSIVAGCLFLSNISVLANPVAAHARDVAVYLETTPDIANEVSLTRLLKSNAAASKIPRLQLSRSAYMRRTDVFATLMPLQIRHS
jgi:hypothetical protein